MIFVWDEAKDRVNRRKHGFSFETATHVFDDPCAVSYLERVIDGEERWQTTGLLNDTLVLLVVHTVGERHGEEEIRIISARKASKRERNLYEAPQ